MIQRFFNKVLGNDGPAPYFAEPWICQQILTQHLYSSAIWTVFPIQDLMAVGGFLRWDETMREQINVPSDPRHRWKYRMHQSVEDLKKANGLNTVLKKLIEQSGRNSDF
jgi:4-alpha-glucanotransferase